MKVEVETPCRAVQAEHSGKHTACCGEKFAVLPGLAILPISAALNSETRGNNLAYTL